MTPEISSCVSILFSCLRYGISWQAVFSLEPRVKSSGTLPGASAGPHPGQTQAFSSAPEAVFLLPGKGPSSESLQRAPDAFFTGKHDEYQHEADKKFPVGDKSAEQVFHTGVSDRPNNGP